MIPGNIDFYEFHKELDDTIIGVIALDEKEYRIFGYSGHILFSSEEATREWLETNKSPQKLDRFEKFTYGDLVRWHKILNLGYFLDEKALAIFRHCDAQDLRVRPFCIRGTKKGGTCVGPFYDPTSDDFEVLELQLNDIHLGFASLEDDFELVTDKNGDVVLFATVDEAAPHPLARRTAIPMTHLKVRNHQAEGFKFAGDPTILARIENLRRWQDYCDEEETIVRNLLNTAYTPPPGACLFLGRDIDDEYLEI